MSGLVAGILAVVITAIIAIVLGIYCYKNRGKSPRGGRYVSNCIIFTVIHLACGITLIMGATLLQCSCTNASGWTFST